jgi:hypothetical protein
LLSTGTPSRRFPNCPLILTGCSDQRRGEGSRILSNGVK